ncbi:MAG: PH domain-containing protein [Gammaproteobacteria bacterium]|nr:PH domain-containing protein [Gammaproteobacteria bacterium]
MSYISDNLTNNEKIIRVGKIHSHIYILVVSLALLGLIGLAIHWIVFLFFLIFTLSFRMYLKSIEIAITSKRLVFKHGLIISTVEEINLSKIEGITIQKDMFTGSGSITIRGVGTGEIKLPWIEDPLEFRREIFEAKELAE